MFQPLFLTQLDIIQSGTVATALVHQPERMIAVFDNGMMATDTFFRYDDMGHPGCLFALDTTNLGDRSGDGVFLFVCNTRDIDQLDMRHVRTSRCGRCLTKAPSQQQGQKEHEQQGGNTIQDVQCLCVCTGGLLGNFHDDRLGWRGRPDGCRRRGRFGGLHGSPARGFNGILYAVKNRRYVAGCGCPIVFRIGLLGQRLYKLKVGVVGECNAENPDAVVFGVGSQFLSHPVQFAGILLFVSGIDDAIR